MTAEIGGCYTRVTDLTFNGQSDGLGTTYSPKLSSISAMAGLRYQF